MGLPQVGQLEDSDLALNTADWSAVEVKVQLDVRLTKNRQKRLLPEPIWGTFL